MTPTCEKLTRRMEDYLEAIGDLVARDGSARVRDIAERTAVSMSTVTASLKQLARAGLVNYDPYELVTLTRSGRRISSQIRHRHDALAEFLQGVLDIDEIAAQANACRMEHVVDDAVLERLSLLGEFTGQDGQGVDWLERFREFCRGRESMLEASHAGRADPLPPEQGQPI